MVIARLRWTDNDLGVFNPQTSLDIASIAAGPKNRFESVNRCSVCSISDSVYVNLESSVIPLPILAQVYPGLENISPT
jgi:hypothetical protein